jgi:transposase-like protein
LDAPPLSADGADGAYPVEASNSSSLSLPSALGLPEGTSPEELLYTTADLFRDFPTNDVCLEYIKEQVWPQGMAHCQKCGVTRKHYRVSGRKAYACNHCGNHIYPLAATIFAKSTTPLKTWFYILYLLLSTGGRISARQVQRETGVTYKTAWRSRGQILDLLFQEDAQGQGQEGKDGTWPSAGRAFP